MAYNYAREQGLCEIWWSWVVMEPECGFGIRDEVAVGLLCSFTIECSDYSSHLHVCARADNRTGQETKPKVHLCEGMYGYDNMREYMSKRALKCGVSNIKQGGSSPPIIGPLQADSSASSPAP
jgi:hypothetical protein